MYGSDHIPDSIWSDVSSSEETNNRRVNDITVAEWISDNFGT